MLSIVLLNEAANTELIHPFKGNVDPQKLDDFLKKHHGKVPFVIVTITNNTAGGQPVSMKNLREVREICNRYGKLLVFDSARFAENAYFIKTREAGYADKSIKTIVREMFSYADAMTMSSKKDAIVNIGGFIAMRDQELWRQCATFNIMFEGYVTYGGMSGRDMNALAVGLDEGTEFDYLETRIRQVEYLGKRLDEFGIPYQKPAGGQPFLLMQTKCFPTSRVSSSGHKPLP